MLKSLPFFSSLLGLELNPKKKAGKVHVLLYGAIEAHSLGPLGCIAGNDDLSQSTGITKSEVRRYLSEIKQAGWVSYEVGKGNQRGKIIPLLEIRTPLRNNSATLAEKSRKPLRNNSASTIEHNRDDILDNTSNGTSPLQVKKKKKAKKVDEPPKVESEEVGHPCAFIGKESGDLCKNKQMKNSEFCSHHAVQEIIDAFKLVNESYLTFYGKKNQHGACKELITTYPKHEILAMIKLAASYNKMPYRAAGDKVYTPHDLFKKWSVMKDNLISYKLQVTQRQKEKQGATKEIVR